MDLDGNCRYHHGDVDKLVQPSIDSTNAPPEPDAAGHASGSDRCRATRPAGPRRQAEAVGHAAVAG